MNKEIAKKLIIALKAETIAFPLCKTPHGELAANLRKGEEVFYFTLDSVPVETELNSDLLKLFSLE